MVQIINKTTKAIFKMDTMTAAEILKKYHFLKLVEADKDELEQIDKSLADKDEAAILSGAPSSKSDEASNPSAALKASAASKASAVSKAVGKKSLKAAS